MMNDRRWPYRSFVIHCVDNFRRFFFFLIHRKIQNYEKKKKDYQLKISLWPHIRSHCMENQLGAKKKAHREKKN